MRPCSTAGPTTWLWVQVSGLCDGLCNACSRRQRSKSPPKAPGQRRLQWLHGAARCFGRQPLPTSFPIGPGGLLCRYGLHAWAEIAEDERLGLRDKLAAAAVEKTLKKAGKAGPDKDKFKDQDQILPKGAPCSLQMLWGQYLAGAGLGQ